MRAVDRVAVTARRAGVAGLGLWLLGTVLPAPAQAEPTPRVQIPPGTWVARPLPQGPEAPCRGGCKHLRFAYSTEDGLFYVLGGDHKGSAGGFLQSGRNEMYTYSVARDEWRLIQPYCRPDRGPQPSHPDEVGWTWDQIRRVFWMVPGFMWNKNPPKQCAEAQFVHGRLMAYDPQAGRWTVHETRLPGKGGWTTQAIHDPATDTITAFSHHGAVGAVAWLLDVKTQEWTRVILEGARNARLADTLPTADPDSRSIYIIPQGQDRLLRYDLDRRTMEDLGPTPPGGKANERMPVWDPVNRVLLFPASADGSRAITLHVYDPRTKRWTTPPMPTEPGGRQVRGRHAVFDPRENVLMVMGLDDLVWLYRHPSP